jgi:hypothetical protein
VPVRKRVGTILLYLILITISSPALTDVNNTALSILLYAGFGLFTLGCLIEFCELARGNPPVWRIIGDKVEVTTLFKRRTFSVDSITIHARRTLPLVGYTLITDGTSSITLSMSDLPPRKRADLEKAIFLSRVSLGNNSTTL